MQISQKAQYALRASFELARRAGDGWVKIAEIAQAQAIPVRFLEVILGQLRQGGFVGSKRGSEGGYMLVQSPEDVTVGHILSYIEGPVCPVDCVNDKAEHRCPFYGNCAFMSLWKRAQDAVCSVYDGTTLAGLVEQQVNMDQECKYIANYAI